MTQREREIHIKLNLLLDYQIVVRQRPISLYDPPATATRRLWEWLPIGSLTAAQLFWLAWDDPSVCDGMGEPYDLSAIEQCTT